MNTKLKAKIIVEYGSQATFSKALGVNEQLVSRVICKRQELPEIEKKVWAKLLSCNSNDIFGE